MQGDFSQIGLNSRLMLLSCASAARLLVGLTATPKDEVDHNTYRLFHLEDGVPTDSYTLDEAVEQGYLVPPKGVSVGTRFLRSGIAYDDLTGPRRTSGTPSTGARTGRPARSRPRS